MKANWQPEKLSIPRRTVNVPSAWRGLDQIIDPLLTEFGIERESCLDMGVDYGFSTVAFSNYFERVVGVDHFKGDEHAGYRDLYDEVKRIEVLYPNIELIQSDYRDFIKEHDEHYNLIHVDIIHSYEDTFKAGEWAVKHADMVIFHDTESFPEVRQAVEDLSDGEWYNYPKHYGLGIIKL